MYEVTIDNFNGPLDLLLHLIKESKMNIFDIKIEIIIDEYFEYLKAMQEKNLDIASSYLVMSSELLEIKSRMLLPSAKEEQVDEEDPKERLLRRLLLYQQYKDQVENFRSLEQERSTYYTKVPSSLEEYMEHDKKIVLNDVSLDDLVKAFKEFLERSNLDKPINTKVTKKELSVDDSMKNIREKLKKEKKINFFDLFEVKTKEYIVVTFLAILELASKNELKIVQENNFDNILCEVL